MNFSILSLTVEYNRVVIFRAEIAADAMISYLLTITMLHKRSLIQFGTRDVDGA